MMLKLEPLLADRRTAIKVVLGVLSVLWLFSFLRLLPVIGEYKLLDHLWLSCSTLSETKVWFKEGAFALGFEQISPSLSIEAQEVVANPNQYNLPLNAARSAYISYPPGALLPVWLLSNLLACEPSLALVRIVNELFCLGIVLMLALSVYVCLENFDLKSRTGAALLAGLFYLYAERTTLVHYSSFYNEIAVMLPVAVVLWYELSGKPDRYKIPVALVVFYGGLCETTVYLLAAVLGADLLIRNLRCQKSFLVALKGALTETWYLSLPLILALLLFTVQLFHLDAFEDLASRVSMRTGRGDEQGNPFPDGLYLSYYNSFFLYFTLAVLLPCLWGVLKSCPKLRCAFGGQQQEQGNAGRLRNLKIIPLYAVACLLHLVILWDYNLIHNFLTIRFYLLFALCIGALTGILFEHLSFRLSLVYTLSVSLIWFALQTSQLKEISAAATLPLQPYAQLIRSQNRFEHVFLSAEFRINDIPPHLLSITGKRVYQLPLREDIYKHFLTLDKAKFKFLITANRLSKQKMTEMENKGFSPEHYSFSELPDLYIYTFTSSQLKEGVESLLAR